MLLKGANTLLFRLSIKYQTLYLNNYSLAFTTSVLMSTVLPVIAQVAILLFGLKKSNDKELIEPMKAYQQSRNTRTITSSSRYEALYSELVASNNNRSPFDPPIENYTIELMGAQNKRKTYVSEHSLFEYQDMLLPSQTKWNRETVQPKESFGDKDRIFEVNSS